MKVVKSNEGVQMDPFGTITKVHWADAVGGVTGSLSVSGGVNEARDRVVTVTIGGYTLPVESIDDVMLSQAFMSTSDIRTWLQERGVTVGTSLTVTVHVSGTSRNPSEHAPPLSSTSVNMTESAFIIWTMANGDTGTVADNFSTGASNVPHSLDLSATISLAELPSS